MNIRKMNIIETQDYLQFADLFKRSGLELNLDDSGKGPEGFITAWKAVDEDGAMVGSCAITRKKDYYVLNDIAVEEELRSTGIGRLLFQTAMTRMLDMGARQVHITAKAPKFFEKYGFRYLEPEDTPDIFGCKNCDQYGKTCKPEFMVFEYSGERLLFIDSCVTTHISRTMRLADHYLEQFIKAHPGVNVETVIVEKGCAEPLDRDDINRRNDLATAGAYDDPMFDYAHQFKRADYVLVGAPYWDCAFPAILKVYIENIVVTGLTFEESETGYSGLCRCKELTYITTAGGPIGDKNLGFDYICGIGDMLGVKSFKEYRAECLDVVGMDHEAIMEQALAVIDAGEI